LLPALNDEHAHGYATTLLTGGWFEPILDSHPPCPVLCLYQTPPAWVRTSR